MPFNVGPGELVIALVTALIVLVPVLLILVAVRFARTSPSGSARRILDERLAPGEITLEQHQTARRAIGG
jgi:uncharacterized membrane protein